MYEYHTTQTQNIPFDLFCLVTFDDIDLTRGQKRLRRLPRSIPDTIDAVFLASFQIDMLTLPGEASDDSKTKSDL